VTVAAEPLRPHPKAGPPARVSWIMFDWATQPFFTLVTTFVFAPYFATQVAATPAQGQALWGMATGAAGPSRERCCSLRTRPWSSCHRAATRIAILASHP
jgi:hypothetical protein